MKVFSFLYTRKNSLLELLNKEGFALNSDCIVEIYTTNLIEQEAVKLKNTILDLLPNASIMGLSVAGVVYNGQNYDEETLIVIKYFETIKCKISNCSLTDNSLDLAQKVLDLSLKNTSIINIFFPNFYNKINQFIKEFNKLNANIKLFGGVIGGSEKKDIEPFIFDNSGILKDKIIFVSFDDNIKLVNNTHLSSRAITESYEVTKTDGIYWDEIDNIPIFEWMDKKLGINKFRQYNKISTAVKRDKLFRIHTILEDGDNSNRFFKYNGDSKKISQYYADVPEGTKFKIGYTSVEECVKEMKNTCDIIADAPSEFMFFYSCLFRKYYFKNLYKIEISPFLNYNITGIFLFGEIAYINNKNQFLNGSCTIISASEKNVHIKPNYAVFDDLNKLTDNIAFINFMQAKHNMILTRKNEVLSKQLHSYLEKDEMIDNKIYEYSYYKMENYIKFQSDDKSRNYTRICLIQIDNADVIQQYAGRDNYFKLIKKYGTEIEKDIRKTNILQYINFYGMQEDKFILAAEDSVSQETFMKYIKYFYNKYNSVQFSELYFIFRFVIAIDIKNPLEVALATLREKKEIQFNFIVCDKDITFTDYSTEIKTIGLIKKAINEDSVVPYYQEIINNRTGEIEKYESLMRLSVDGKIYNPPEFINIAKKYHVYSYLSEAMVEKVIKDFNGRKEMVNINISIYDIKSDRFTEKLLKLLDEYRDVNLCIEITEEENYNNVEGVVDFMKILREKNIKIAIDDFGSGYSNFVNVLNLHPDYIKIDGEIIKNLDKENNMKILESLIFLGKQFDVDLIAEFVENESIFNCLKEKDTKYSQGFYISKPKPLEKL